jgi:uncharacterized membrane protein YagU involved in acid resistance
MVRNAMRRVVTGLAAGFGGTVAMTLAMEAMFRLLPRSQQAPLPPRQITERAAQGAGVQHLLDEQERFAAAMVAHFLYGSVVGAGYVGTARHLPGAAFAKGTLFSLVVWAASYQGWVPALGFLLPASEWPQGRNVLMIAAHVVWGSAIAALTEAMNAEESAERPSPRATRNHSRSGHTSQRTGTPCSQSALP